MSLARITFEHVTPPEGVYLNQINREHMQTIEEWRTYNREKAREWRSNNVDRARIIRWQSKRRSLGLSEDLSLYTPKDQMIRKEKPAKQPRRIPTEKPVRIRAEKIAKEPKQKLQSTTIHEIGFVKRPSEYYEVKTPIELCITCYRKYLVPLGCLFCK